MSWNDSQASRLNLWSGIEGIITSTVDYEGGPILSSILSTSCRPYGGTDLHFLGQLYVQNKHRGDLVRAFEVQSIA